VSARAALGIALALGLLASQASAGSVCVNKTGGGGCQTSIQTAVNMAVATPPGIVKIGPGTYFETVTTPDTAGGGDDLQIIGSGKTLTIIDSGPPTNAEGIVLGAAVGVKVANLTVQNSAGQGGIFASTGADDAVISGVGVLGAASLSGINITGNGVQVLSSEVRGCRCGDGNGLGDGTGFGIVVFGNQGILKGNTVAQSGGAVAAAIAGDGGQVVANKVISFGHVDATIDGTPLLLGVVATGQNGTGGSIVTGNTIENLGPGDSTVSVFGAAMLEDARPTLSSNRLINAGAIVAQCTGCTPGGLVKGNTVTGSPTHTTGLIVITDAAGLTAQQNKLSYTGGVTVLGNTGLTSGSGVTLLQNTVTGTHYPRDCFEVSGSGHTLTGNNAKDCGASGFWLVGDDLLLSGNSVSGARQSGFSIDGYNGGGTPHFGITLQDNKASGVFQGFAIFDSNAAHGPDQPTSVTLTGNTGSLERQDFCHEDAGSYPGNTFTTIATTCDVRH
jgi:hypothetical protein